MKKVPEIRFAEYVDNWEQRKLGDLAVEVKRKADKDSEAPVMMISASEGFIDQSQRYSNNNAGSSLKNYTLLYEGELAYNHGYSKFRNFGSVFDLKVEKARIPFVYHSFALPEDDHRFFAYYLNSGLFDGELKKLVSSTARMDGLLNISYEDYMSIPVLRPPVQEQEKIGEYFSKLDSLITLHQRKLEKLMQFKSSMLEKMFPKNGESVPEIRFAGFTGAWEQRELGEIAEKVTEKNVLNLVTETFTNSAEFGVISQRDYFDHDIAKAEKVNGYYIIQNDDFVYNPRISVSAPCGPINCNRLGRNGVMSPLYTVFRTHDIDTLYLEWFFKSHHWHSYMYFNGDSGARSDRFSIKNELFFQMPIPVPSLKEQHLVGETLQELNDLITLHQRKLEKLKQFKSGLLDKMFI